MIGASMPRGSDALLTKKEGQSFGKTPCPGGLVVRAIVFYDEAQASFIEPGTSQRPGELPHVVHGALISIGTTSFGGSDSQKNPFRPTFDTPGLPNHLAI